MIVAVSTVRNEADIIETSIRHLLAEGVDRILIADGRSTDGTRDILQDLYEETNGIVGWYDDAMEFHDQPRWIDGLASKAREGDWIIPFDADEFWYGRAPHLTIKETLEALPPEVKWTTVPMWQQRDWNHIDHDQKPMVKVAYRWEPGASIDPGNHGVTLPSGNGDPVCVLMLREIQYRSFEHFCRKVEERNATLDPAQVEANPNHGFHMTRLREASRQQLADEWDTYQKRDWSWDPIPSRYEHVPAYLWGEEDRTSISAIVDQNRLMWSDIRGHLDRLRAIVEETKAQTVIELGVNTGLSTAEFLYALQPQGMLFSCDIAEPRVRPDLLACGHWHLYVEDDMTWTPPVKECDVLFIDTSHTHDHTLAELKKFGPLVRPGGCIILHDEETYPEQKAATNHYIHLLKAEGRFQKLERYVHDNGLAVIWV